MLDVEYTLYHCENCRSRFFDINEHKVPLEDLYERLAEEYLNSNSISIRFRKEPYWEYQKNILLKLLGREAESILDIGCRTGEFLMHFDEKIIREGVELSKSYSEIATERGLSLYSDYLENVHFRRKYDFVTAFAIMEHLARPLEFLNRLHNILKPNGLLLIMIPTYECAKGKILTTMNYRWHMYRPPEHLNFFSRRFLDNYLNEKGIELVKRYYTAGGMFNPFRRVRLANKIFGKIMSYHDRSVLNNFAIFDHMYSIYKRSPINEN